MGRMAGRFARVEPRRRATSLVLGLLSDLPRKNCWTLAEHAGDATPDGMQHLLHRAKWDADAVRDDVRAYVVEHLADEQAVLDEVYGDNPHLRITVERRRTGYVLAVSSTHPIIAHSGRFQAKTLAARIPRRAWQRLSAGSGAKGERYYDWAQVEIHDPADWPGHWCLLVRRNHRTGEFAFYRCFSPRPVPLSELVRVAGRRWTIEETFQAGKGLTGLDEHQVGRWASWHRWVTLAMLAHAFLAVTAAIERSDRPAFDSLIPLTGNEIQHLFAALVSPVHDLRHRLRWSHWRRRQQGGVACEAGK
ncbi:IS701 family transposase [Streptomyces microflavus]|uniref:IS701 family transposase n=1 Tax=Streptomyces microflavus TaxID=1919 RepID=UPI0038102EEC